MIALKHGNLPSNAVLILLYLSTYMNQRGDSCYPAVATICGETGLTKPTVIKYLNVLRDGGWVVSKSIGSGQGWSHNQYYPIIPENVVKEINRLAEGGKTHSITRLNSSSNAVKELNPIYPIPIQELKEECIKPSGSTRANGVDFDRFWEHWPRKINKHKAKIAFQSKQFSVSDVDLLITDVKRRKEKDKQWAGGYIPHCSTYLNGKRWEDDYGN